MEQRGNYVTVKRWGARRKTAQALAQRARLILACAQGCSNNNVSAQVGLGSQSVGKWHRRFLDKRLDRLLDEQRPGAPRKITDADVEPVITLTLEATPADATHWSTRSMAKRSGLSHSAVSRIWRAFALEPHPTKTFKLSKDPLFIEKVRDVVGLYLKPPDKAPVPCVNEESGIQALDRTAPLLSMRPGQIKRRTRLYAQRHFRPVCGLGGCHRQGHCPLPKAPPVGGFPKVPRSHRRLGARRVGRPHDPGQVRDSQNGPDSSLAGATPALSCAFPADEFVVAQPGGEMV